VTRVVAPRLRQHRPGTTVLDPELARRYAELSREAAFTP
jgi:hypothetical protein